MLGGWPRVHRWEQTDDGLQNALLRLYHALADARAFFRLAALSIRRELFDLAKRYYGTCGLGANHATAFWRSPKESESPEVFDTSPASETDDPSRRAAWAEFHFAHVPAAGWTVLAVSREAPIDDLSLPIQNR